MPTDLLLFQQFSKAHYPFICVLTCFTTINRHVILITKVEVFLNYILGSGRPVFMKSINESIVKWRTKNFEIGIPLCTTQKNQVIFICLPNCFYNPFVQRLKQRVEFFLIKIMSDGFI